jgi:predicted small metal-binding protein
MPKGHKTIQHGSEGFIYMCPCEYHITASSDREIDCKIRLHQKRCRLGKSTHITVNDTNNIHLHDTKNKHLAIEAFNKINQQQLKF